MLSVFLWFCTLICNTEKNLNNLQEQIQPNAINSIHNRYNAQPHRSRYHPHHVPQNSEKSLDPYNIKFKTPPEGTFAGAGGYGTGNKCSDFTHHEDCRGAVSPGLICLWNSELEVCNVESEDDGDAICGQYGTTEVCAQDLRCDWDSGDLECIETETPKEHTNDPNVWPPYSHVASSSASGSIEQEQGPWAISEETKPPLPDLCIQRTFRQCYGKAINGRICAWMDGKCKGGLDTDPNFVCRTYITLMACDPKQCFWDTTQDVCFSKEQVAKMSNQPWTMPPECIDHVPECRCQDNRIEVNGRDEYGQVCMEKHQQSAKLALFYDFDSLNECKKYCAGNSKCAACGLDEYNHYYALTGCTLVASTQTRVGAWIKTTGRKHYILTSTLQNINQIHVPGILLMSCSCCIFFVFYLIFCDFQKDAPNEHFEPILLDENQ